MYLTNEQFKRFLDLLTSVLPWLQQGFDDGGVFESIEGVRRYHEPTSSSSSSYSSGCSIKLVCHRRRRRILLSSDSNDDDGCSRGDDALFGEDAALSLQEGFDEVDDCPPANLAKTTSLSLLPSEEIDIVEFCILNHPTFRIPTVFASGHNSRGEPKNISALQAFLRSLSPVQSRSQSKAVVDLDNEGGGGRGLDTNSSSSGDDKQQLQPNELLFYDLEEHPYTGQLGLSIHNCALAALPLFKSSNSTANTVAATTTTATTADSASSVDLDLPSYVACWLSLFGPFLGCKVSPILFQDIIAQAKNVPFLD